jgi:Winged helix-turn-helix domain (DUF2582)
MTGARRQQHIRQRSQNVTYEIGEGAGRIWQFLSEHPASTWEQIKKDLKLDTNVFFMSVGWLAREGKLLFDGEGKKTKVSLK